MAEVFADGERIVRIARRWIGTPYHHQASCEGAGADCLGLVRGIWRELFGVEPEPVPAYTPDWSEPDRIERLMEGAERHLLTVPFGPRTPGDVLLFRLRSRSVAKHVAILAGGPAGQETIVHSYSGHGVCETPLGAAWERRIAGLYRFPDRSH